jgi:hypothetical protein
VVNTIAVGSVSQMEKGLPDHSPKAHLSKDLLGGGMDCSSSSPYIELQKPKL